MLTYVVEKNIDRKMWLKGVYSRYSPILLAINKFYNTYKKETEQYLIHDVGVEYTDNDDYIHMTVTVYYEVI